VLLRQVRRVRAALDQGVLDDPELTSDLSPTVPVQRLGRDPDDIDYVREDPLEVPTVLTPAQAAGLGSDGRTEDTGVIAAARGPVSGASRAVPPRGPRPVSRRGPLLLVLALLLVAAGGVGGWWLGFGRFTTTPGVLNLPARVAESRLAAAGLGFEVAGRAYSERVPVGRVLRTDPAGGENVTRNGTVSAVLSRGPERHRVPALANLTLDQAQAALDEARLGFGDASYVYSDKLAKGVVVRSTPRQAAVLRRGAVVDLVVSKGPPPVRVPDFTGKAATDAATAFAKLRLKVERSLANSDTVEKGDVVSQAPNRGRLFRGDTVKLVVSKGPVLVEVPRVVGTSSGDAESALEQAGFSVRILQVEYYIALGVVVKQSPGSGELAPRGGTVTLYIV
jgi:serine/threonine-protein kinase